MLPVISCFIRAISAEEAMAFVGTKAKAECVDEYIPFA